MVEWCRLISAFQRILRRWACGVEACRGARWLTRSADNLFIYVLLGRSRPARPCL
jgi:hypothetical protein